MKRPAFQFYTGDWSGNAKLRRCTHAEKGVWIDVMCLMHDSEEEYGVLRWPLEDVAQAIGAKIGDLKGLIRKGVLKGADDGERCKEFVFVPTHAGKPGEPVVLVPAQDGPIWYSSRMVRDEYIRGKRGENTRFEESPKPTPKAAPKVAPKPPIGDDMGTHFGDGPSSSSSSSSSSSNTTTPLTPFSAGAEHSGANGHDLLGEAKPTAREVLNVPHEAIVAAYHELLPMCPKVAVWSEKRKRLLKARWTEDRDRQSINWWREFFGWVAKSKFLTGNCPPTPPRNVPFLASLEWLLAEGNFIKIVEGTYNRDVGAAQ